MSLTKTTSGAGKAHKNSPTEEKESSTLRIKHPDLDDENSRQLSKILDDFKLDFKDLAGGILH
jgi:hypothetical protein